MAVGWEFGVAHRRLSCVVERTFAWLGQNRRMSKDYERLCATGEAVHLRRHEPTDGQAAGACLRFDSL
jgi:transposase